MKKEHKYELMVILKPNLPENVRNSAVEKIQSVLTSSSANVTTSDNWGKRYLAYPIMKHNEGYYMIYDFDTTPDKIEELSKALNLVNQVLRFTILNK